MTSFQSTFISLTAILLIALGTPESVLATTRIVNPADASCSTSTTPPCYTSITTALTAAVNGDVIQIHPGTYTGTYTITQQLTITGTETARTILSGGGAGPIFTVDGAANVAIRRLTFTNAATGISAIGSTINVTNTIFTIGTAATAIELDASSTGNIINNTFYQNLTAISFASGAVMDIENNIFYGTGAGSTAISSSAAAATLQYNSFFNITAGQTGTVGNVTTNPQFVAPGTDFHLLLGSPCINTGTISCGLCGADKIPDSVNPSASDLGAYGGPASDTIPFPVSGLIAADVSVLPPPYTVQLTWNANLCYQVLGYKVRTGTASGSYAAPDNVGNVTTIPVAGLTAAPAPTGAPVLTNDIANQTLLLTWTTGGVSGATGYEIRYSDTVTPPLTPIVDAGNTMFYALTGLTNNTSYYVSVTPYAQRTYYFTVTAYYNAADANYESAYSNETSQPIGPKVYGASSNVIHDYPELITPMPNLPNSGNCFIATAAYGHYSAPQVRALREFRDRYLMTNEPGRAFVRWYYRYGPIGAEFMEAHPWLKPIVRITLLPIVGGALCMTQTSYVTKALFVLFGGSCLLCVILVYRDRKKKT